MKKLTLEEFSKKISNKFILFDTCVIIRAFEYPEAFEEFLNFIRQSNCASVLFSFIIFEFIRGAYEITHRQKREEFLKELAFKSMPFQSDDIMKDAINIANAYAARKLHSSSPFDCCIAAFLKKYFRNLFLVTLNHKDFPTFLFDRIFIYPVDTDKEVFPLAFYQYNDEKAKKIGLD